MIWFSTHDTHNHTVCAGLAHIGISLADCSYLVPTRKTITAILVVCVGGYYTGKLFWFENPKIDFCFKLYSKSTIINHICKNDINL